MLEIHFLLQDSYSGQRHLHVCFVEFCLVALECDLFLCCPHSILLIEFAQRERVNRLQIKEQNVNLFLFLQELLVLIMNRQVPQITA